MKNRLLLDALKCENSRGRPPVWLMRQAGRYMPEYRKIREKHSFLEMCHSPELAAKVTLLPVDRFGMDAAILFSDILVIPEALDMGLYFDEGRGPIFDRPLEKASDIERLPNIDVGDRLSFVKEAIALIKKECTVPLIGFAGAPFTVASYMIEGGSNKALKKTKKWMFDDPASFHCLLDRIAETTIDYLNMQIDAGVDALQLFESWASYLSFSHFKEFSLRYLEKISGSLKKRDLPLILFCRGSSAFAGLLASIRPCALSIDWNADLEELRKSFPPPLALQGNLDPDILCAPHAVIRKEVLKLLGAMRGDPGYIFNLGHGITPDVPPDAVQLLVDTVKYYH